MKIPGSVAIVTGGARGFGKAFTEELLKRGAKVCFADVNISEGRSTEATLRQKYGDQNTTFVQCDITKDSDFKELWRIALEKYNYVDIMVNNAGILNENAMEKTIDINLLGTIRGSNLALQNMRRDLGGKGGLIINVASTAGLFPVFFMPVYTASKYGVVGFTRSWASNPSLQSYGVSFACLCPAFSETSMLTGILNSENPPLITYTENQDAVEKAIQRIGVNSVDNVSSAFVQLVEKEDNNGAVVTIEKSRGAIYRFAKHPHKL